MDILSVSCFSCFPPSYLNAIISHPDISLNEYNKLIFRSRYIVFLVMTEKRRMAFKIWYYGLRIFIQTGTVITPAILSWQLFTTHAIANTFLAWFVWCVMLLTAIFSSYISLFSLDKKLLLYDSGTEALQNEIWSFLELSGRYSRGGVGGGGGGGGGAGDNEVGWAGAGGGHITHNSVFILFCNQMNKLIRRISQREHMFMEQNVSVGGGGAGSGVSSTGVGIPRLSSANATGDGDSPDTLTPILRPSIERSVPTLITRFGNSG